MKRKPELRALFAEVLRIFKIPLMPEHSFHPKRKWRFDYADLKNKIAVEVEGGVWIRGRHNRGAGYIADCDKYNEAQLLGWRVIRIASEAQAWSFPELYKRLC